jgi:hypothetical protein
MILVLGLVGRGGGQGKGLGFPKKMGKAGENWLFAPSSAAIILYPHALWFYFRNVSFIS